MEDQILLTAEEAAEFLGVSRSTFHHITKREELPVYVRDENRRRFLFKREDLQALKDKRSRIYVRNNHAAA